MYIPTTFFSSNGGTIIASGGTQGTFFSGSQPYGYHLFTTPGTASFTVFSGSVQNARVVVIGGGGGGMRGDNPVGYALAAAGGGAGGVYIDNRIAIAPRTYQIVVGAGGNEGNFSKAGFNDPWIYTTPTSGLQSTFQYPLYPIYGYGGGYGGYAGGLNEGENLIVLGGTGASGGGNAQRVNSAFVPSSTPTQGNRGGSIDASFTPAGATAYSSTGGGGFGGPSDSLFTSSTNSTTAGGIGIQIPIYPINGNTASYFAGGGGSYGVQPEQSSAGGLGYDTYGGGGNGRDSNDQEPGRGGLVYIEYPLYSIVGRYTFLRYNVDENCNLTTPATQVWSQTNYADGFYSIGGIQYKLEANVHATFTTEITSAIPSFCPVRYTFLRYDVDESCNLSNPTEVWSEINFSNGFYTIGGIQYRLEANTHTTYTTQITSAASSTCPPPPPPFPISGSLVIWSDTTSLTSSIWYDKSGRNNNGLVSGSTLSLSGSLGYAFNGTNNYVTYPTTLVGQPSSSYTLQYYGSLPSESVVNRDFFVKEDYTNGWDTIWEQSVPRFVLRDVAGGDRRSPSFTPTYGAKQLITITANDSTNVIELYVNNTLIGNFSGVLLNAFNVAARPFVFGFNTNSDATYFKGGVTALLLYNKVLNATEVSQSYAYMLENF